MRTYARFFDMGHPEGSRQLTPGRAIAIYSTREQRQQERGRGFGFAVVLLLAITAIWIESVTL